MQQTTKLSNLQLELLKIFSFDISEQQLLDIKSILADYFAQSINNDIDKLFEENNWGIEKIEEWSEEHMRTKYDNS